MVLARRGRFACAADFFVGLLCWGVRVFGCHGVFRGECGFVSIYVVTGKLGSGKSLACVARIRDALEAGKRVATNLDLNLEKLLPWSNRTAQVIRIPDKPTVQDLEGIGCGNRDYDESKNGVIVLDELGAWLNTRSWGDKERQPVIDWLLHSRKKGWDVYFIIQHSNMVDKQVREGLAEFIVTCKRTDRLRIPLITAAFKHWGLNIRPPQIHVATVRYGLEPEALVSDRWWYRARELFAAYDTRQVFTSARTGLYSLLPPYHLTRGLAPPKSDLDRLLAWLRPDAQRRPAAMPKLPWVERLLCLPPDDRIRWWQRLQSDASRRVAGAFRGSGVRSTA